MASTVNGSDNTVNWLSISSGIAGLLEGTANPTSCPLPINGAVIQPTQAVDAVLKICDTTNGLTLTGLQVYQGGEDSVNCQNQAHDIHLAGDFALGTVPGLQAFTIKGGCYDVTISGVVHQHGTYSTVTIGEWSDQFQGTTHDVDLSGLTMSDGTPIIVVMAQSDNVKLPPGAKVLFWASLELKAYVTFKGLVRDVLRIPVGTPGPSWLP